MYFPQPSAHTKADDPTDCPQGHVNQPHVSAAASSSNKNTHSGQLRVDRRDSQSAGMHSSVTPVTVMHGLPAEVRRISQYD